MIDLSLETQPVQTLRIKRLISIGVRESHKMVLGFKHRKRSRLIELDRRLGMLSLILTLQIAMSNIEKSMRPEKICLGQRASKI